MEPTKVGIREFRAGLAEYIASDKPVAVTRHGQTVGYFIPTHAQTDADMAALKQAWDQLDRLLATQGVDIEDIASEFKAARSADAATRRSARKRA
jgi:antitoxin (DNA-binding transcriptional repressor) of toxin-antitoxin stability system